MGPELWRLVLVNSGVKLTIDGSEVLEDLRTYDKGGLKILVCGTCLNHFNLLERKRVGETTNMLDDADAPGTMDIFENLCEELRTFRSDDPAIAVIDCSQPQLPLPPPIGC